MIASFAVALMAGFTGLSLTRGASDMALGQRKLAVVMAAIALGGGIWSMHFVAMLGLQLPFAFHYDALITLISALIAILMVGLALLILHFLPRSLPMILLSGAIVGLGIAVMHFVGMLGMQVCRPVNGIGDYVLSTLAAVALSILAIWVAYGERTRRNILRGTLGFGFAVVAVHYIAIAQTGFVKADAVLASGPVIDNQSLAMGVTLAAFLICGAFLLTGVTFVTQPAAAAANGAPDTAIASADGLSAPVPPASGPGAGAASVAAQDRASPAADDLSSAPAAPDAPGAAAATTAGIPFERDGRTQFAPRETVAAIRAEGHYTILYIGPEKLFCPWSITEADARLAPAGFVRTHRSYLVNPARVSGFERLKDTGALYFDSVESLPKVPVSRSRLTAVREALGL